MKKIIKLTQILYKTNRNADDSSNSEVTLSKSQMQMIYTLVFGVVVVIGAFILGQKIADFGEMLIPTIIKAMFVMFSIAILLMQLGKIIATFYLDSDIEAILVLPYRPVEIVLAKFICVMIPCYAIVLAMLLPFLVGVGLAMSYGAMYWICMIISLLLFPLVPLVYAGIISIVIMRVFKKIRNRNILTMIGSILPILIMVIYEVLNMTVFKDISTTEMGNMVAQQTNMINTLCMIFPSTFFLSDAIIHLSLLSLLFGCAVCVFAVAILIFAACRWYFTGVLQMKNGTSNNKAMSTKQISKSMKSKSIHKILIQKDLRNIVRTPIHLTQCVIVPLSVLLLISIMTVLSPLSDPSIGKGLVVFLTVMLSAFCPVAITSFSREGSDMIFMKQMPISQDIIFKAKRDTSIIINTFILLPCSLIAVIPGTIKGNGDWLSLLLACPIPVLLLALTSSVNVYLDSVNPVKEWKTETAVYSKVLIRFIMPIVNIVLMMIIAIISGLSEDFIGVYGTFLVTDVLLAAITFTVNRFFEKLSKKNIDNM